MFRGVLFAGIFGQSTFKTNWRARGVIAKVVTQAATFRLSQYEFSS